MKKVGKVILWLVVVFLVIEAIGIALMYYSRRIPEKTVLTLDLQGWVGEQSSTDPFTQLVAGPQLTVTDILEALERAKRDSRITGIEVRVGETTMNMAKMQEIRAKLGEFNRAGKFSVAYLEFATNGPYYLASACQTVFLMPKSALYVRGLMASATFLRGTLDKLGVRPDLYHTGEYKNAMNIYTEKKYTPAHREATQVLLEDWYEQFLQGIAEARGLDPGEARKAIERGPLNPQDALTAKLVDRVDYADKVREFVKQKNAQGKNRLSLRDYLKRTERKGRSKLAVIYATGTIVPGRSGDGPFGETMMGSDTMAEQLRRAREDSSLRAVILRVDSPGGVVFPAEVIRREVELTAKKKPVVVSMSDVAASGGYWIAAPAQKIVAEPGTVTGSIGVITGKFNVRGLYEKLGLSKDYVATAENATLDWPFQDYTPAQRESVQKFMAEIYQDFLSVVADGRHMSKEAVNRIAQGRVWTGKRAQELGLVDELGGLDKAIAVAKQLAKIPKEEQVSLVFLPPTRSLVEKILDLLDTSAATVRCSPREWLRSLEGWAQTPVWAILPAVPEAR